METSLFLLIVEIIGTIAFAISGIRLAAAKQFDWFGAYVVGLVSATCYSASPPFGWATDGM